MNALHGLISAEINRTTTPDAQACTSYICRRFGAGTAGVLLYGASLRGNATDTMLDFYVLVDSPRAVLNSVVSAIAAELLPPNVYMMAIPMGDRVQRAKVAVMSLAKFERGSTAFASQIWGRFAQPAILTFARDDAARHRIVVALAVCVETFVRRTLALVPAPCSAETLWVRGVRECYAAELRPELNRRTCEVVAEHMTRHEAITRALLPAGADGHFHPAPQSHRRAKFAWWLRRRWGKTLNAARLMKAAFTFAGGLDYAVAKIARHTGIKIPVSDRDRRHPLLAGIRVFLKARWRGGVR